MTSVSTSTSEPVSPLLEQPGSMPMALVGGGIAAVISGGVWALIAHATGYEIGWIAIGVGFLCGLGVRFLGKGETNLFRGIGAGSAFFGIILGKLMAITWGASDAGIPGLSLSDELAVLKEAFSPIDLLFYGIALWEGWKFSVSEG
jgi:hypothetical protein